MVRMALNFAVHAAAGVAAAVLVAAAAKACDARRRSPTASPDTPGDRADRQSGDPAEPV